MVVLYSWQGFFLDIMKKTQAQKNSKLKQNLEKTQAKSRKKLKNRQLQLSSDGGIFFTNPKVFPNFAHVVNFAEIERWSNKHMEPNFTHSIV